MTPPLNPATTDDQPPSHPRIDSTVPQSARVWNYWLGGKDNYAIDREVGEQIRQANPHIAEIAVAQRQFLVRTTSYLVHEAGIRQFLDVGIGPHLLFGLLWIAGARPSWVLPVWVSLAGAIVGAVVVDARVRRLAAARRVALRQALSVQLDLTMMGLAGGAGVEQALTDAAVVGNGWAHEQLRRALDTARATRIPIWTALGELGARTGVNELVELSAAVALAGHEGAKIRSTLGARAAAMRQRQTFDQETKAASATERMTLPSVLLLAAFMTTIGYPAIATILTGL